jgi:uncharacterized repeat protein (TIGR03803 family)
VFERLNVALVIAAARGGLMSSRRRWRMLGILLALVIPPVSPAAAWAEGKYKTLHKFESSGIGGSALTGGLILDQLGNLYGTAGLGGTYSQGTVFELIPQSNGSWREKVLHSFTGGLDGGIPLATLVADEIGNLYGTARQGGNDDAGVVFKLAPNQDGSWTESVLYSFTGGADGYTPFAGIIFDQAGNLYGTTLQGGSSSACIGGCGTVFKLTAKSDGSWTESILYSFCSLDGCRDGAYPFIASLIFDQTGNLYGTTEYGGNHRSLCENNGCGVVFQLSPSPDGSWKETVLHRFCSSSSCGDGVYPLDSLIFDRIGNLYGTAEFGGAAGGGVVFELIPNKDGSWREKVLHSFAGRSEGGIPVANLVADEAGNLYGTAEFGGAAGNGVVFKLTPNSKGGWHETVLHAFQDHPGALPNAGVIFDDAGNLYGTTYGDDNTTFGSVFEITP